MLFVKNTSTIPHVKYHYVQFVALSFLVMKTLSKYGGSLTEVTIFFDNLCILRVRFGKSCICSKAIAPSSLVVSDEDPQ